MVRRVELLKITIEQLIHSWYVESLKRSFVRRDKALQHAQKALHKRAQQAAKTAGREHRK